MIIMNLVFVALMLGVHYPVAWLVTRRMLVGLDADVQREIRARMANRMRVLFVLWLGSLIGVVAAALTLPEQAPGIVYPCAMVGFHLLWWPFIVPILQRVSRELEQRGVVYSNQASSRRTASLRRRRLADYLSVWMRSLPWAVGVSGAALIAWLLIAHRPDSEVGWLHASVFTASAIFILVAWNIGMQREAETGYALPGDAEQKADELRRFRILGFYWIHLAMAAGFFGAAALGIEVDRGTIRGEIVGVYGAVVGTGVGVLGGLFGTVASLRAHRVARGNSSRP